MFRGVLRRLAARFGRGGSDTEDDTGSDDGSTVDEQGEDGRFVPSVLDASVRYAHGQSATGIEGELVEVEQRARELEEQRDR